MMGWGHNKAKLTFVVNTKHKGITMANGDMVHLALFNEQQVIIDWCDDSVSISEQFISLTKLLKLYGKNKHFIFIMSRNQKIGYICNFWLYWTEASLIDYTINTGHSQVYVFGSLKRTPNAKRSPLYQYWSYNLYSSFKPVWFVW